MSGLIRSIGSGQSDGHSESIFGIILSYIIWPIIKVVLILSNWEIDAASAYRKLSNKNKFYTLVRSSIEDRSKKIIRPNPDEKIVKRIVERIKDDSIITHYASLHLSVYAKWKQVLYKERFRSLTLSSILLLLSVALFLSFGGALVPAAIAAPVPLLIGFSYAKAIAMASVLLVSLVMVTWTYFERKSKLGLKQKDTLYPEGLIEYEDNIVDETSPRGVFRTPTDKPGKTRNGFAKLEVKVIRTHWGPDCGHNKFLEELSLRDNKTGSTGRHVFGKFFNKDRKGSISAATTATAVPGPAATLAL